MFETMNSTGKRLSQADLIRNFVLMDLPPTEQTRLYESYWFPMEQSFAGPHEKRFDEFVRHYLTMKTGNIPRLDDIYDAFKNHAEKEAELGTSRERLVVDLHRYSRWFAAMALARESDRSLKQAFQELEQLRANVVYPFLLQVYDDYANSIITAEDFLRILEAVISYLFRRAVCQIPTNSLNKTFVGLRSAIDRSDYVESVLARFQLMATYTRFPTDDEFKHSLVEINFYNFKRARYFFRKMENFGRKEEVSIADYSVEHIMPQNEKLSSPWQQALGPEWRQIQEKHLHTLGNLTLTGYNPEYSDRPFEEKRDMPGGFKESPLKLNQGLGQIETWNEEEIVRRGHSLAERALEIWHRPQLNEEVISAYKKRSGRRTGFDWTLTHSILDQLPSGTWTSYYQLAEAVGTSAQALAGHISKCTDCVNAYRVLTWDGRISTGFSWINLDDTRSPREVLENEGIRFVEGAADPEDRLDTEGLLALIDD